VAGKYQTPKTWRGDYIREKLRLMPAALDRINRIMQNFSWVDGALRLNDEFRIVNVE